MRLISHRGNLNGPYPHRENNPEYIEEVLKLGYEVEVDIRLVNNKFFLGHDKPMFKLPEKFLNNNKIWFHCKDFLSLEKFNLGIKINKPHFFYHESDPYTITSQGHIWVYPGEPLLIGSIYVLPEQSRLHGNYSMCAGICSDYIENYKNF